MNLYTNIENLRDFQGRLKKECLKIAAVSHCYIGIS